MSSLIAVAFAKVCCRVSFEQDSAFAELAQTIARISEGAVGHRKTAAADAPVELVNVARHPASFWLQTSTQRTYPDFVAELTDGRIFVVEYKGADHWADAAEDRAIGEVWARATGNLYLMVRAKDDHGRAPLAQLMAHLD